MSVLKAHRSESKAEFVNVANKIYIQTIAFLSRLSSRYSRLVSKSVSELASEVVDHAEKANSILLCTQQCLPSSVNFEFVNKVIIPELHYNNARMSQFYMRFVRFTSTDWKDIYFVTYSGSIESNQMQMVLAKEKLNLFMKGQDVDLDEVYDRFGVDYDLMSLLMSREADEDGNFKISWGEQKIS